MNLSGLSDNRRQPKNTRIPWPGQSNPFSNWRQGKNNKSNTILTSAPGGVRWSVASTSGAMKSRGMLLPWRDGKGTPHPLSGAARHHPRKNCSGRREAVGWWLFKDVVGWQRVFSVERCLLAASADGLQTAANRWNGRHGDGDIISSFCCVVDCVGTMTCSTY